MRQKKKVNRWGEFQIKDVKLVRNSCVHQVACGQSPKMVKSEKKNNEVELCPPTLVHAWWTGMATF